MTDALIPEEHWPDGLDPETVSFATRIETVLRRHSLYDDPAQFNTLTVAEVAGWANTGPVTIANNRTTPSTHHIPRFHQLGTDHINRVGQTQPVISRAPSPLNSRNQLPALIMPPRPTGGDKTSTYGLDGAQSAKPPRPTAAPTRFDTSSIRHRLPQGTSRSPAVGANLGAKRCGRVWTAMDAHGHESPPFQRLWTGVDTVWRFTDQKVGGSSPSGRAAETLSPQEVRRDEGLLTF